MIRPATVAAAALVFPAPKTTLIGQSVLPSSCNSLSADKVARKCPSLFRTKVALTLSSLDIFFVSGWCVACCLFGLFCCFLFE